MMNRVSHDPQECRVALLRTRGPVVLDLETTGLRRSDQIVSVGLLIDGVAYVLFFRSMHFSIRNIDPKWLPFVLKPLEAGDHVLVGHNLAFDIKFLRGEGVHVRGVVHDTLKILRLLDQDRGTDKGASSGQRVPRKDLRAPVEAPYHLDYRLKHVVPQLLGIRMPEFPGQIEMAPYQLHATYLASDLLGTKILYDFLWPKLSADQQTYYGQLVSPLIHLLVDMEEVGVQADPDFIHTEADRLDTLMQRISERHEHRHGVSLGMNYWELKKWLHEELELPVLKKKRWKQFWVPSVDAEAIRRLREYNEDPRIDHSLRLLQRYRRSASLLVRLKGLLKYIEPSDGRIHSTFDDKQATGRVSSTGPNLQQLAGQKWIAGMRVRCRNALQASPGHELIAFDIAQADVRVLASVVEDFPVSMAIHKMDHRLERDRLLRKHLDPYLPYLDECRNSGFISTPTPSLDFDPAAPCVLADDFRSSGDFYSKAVKRILGKPPKDKAERNRFKPVVLAIINGKGPPSLAKDLKCSEAEARQHLDAFAAAYPKSAAYKEMMYWQIAYTGQTSTFMGRVRTITPHRWLVAEPSVEFLVTYRYGDRYWVQAVPLRPSRRVLTTYVQKVWNARSGKLIYDHQRGRLGAQPYRLFRKEDLQYRLPIRNWAWRSIRRVRAQGQEAVYDGFDATARSAFNFICQGGTADVAKIMMLRSRKLCSRFNARLLIQIHDELVFEVPSDRVTEFAKATYAELQRPPAPSFQVPIVVEAKRGKSFGDMVGLPPPP